MTRREIETLLRDFYEGRSRNGNPWAWGEIAPGVYWEFTRGPGALGGEVIGVYIVAQTPDGLRELPHKCKACGSSFLARKHIKALKMSYGTWQSKETKAKVKAAKLTETPRKRGKGLTKIKRSA